MDIKRKGWVFLFFAIVIHTCVCSQGKERNTIKAVLINKALSTYNKVRSYDDKYSTSFSNYDLNATLKYNDMFYNIVSSSDFSKLSNTDLKRISNVTGLKILISKDNKLKVVSWGVFNSAPEPKYSNILIGNKKNKIVPLKGKRGKDFRIDFELDTIIDILSKNKTHYLLMGSNKCGNLCIQKSVFLYTIIDSNVIECSNAFFDDIDSINNIRFSYTINENMISEPFFYIDNNELITPIISDDKLSIIGNKRYKIIFNIN